MAKQTVKSQKQMIDSEHKIIENIVRYYEGHELPEFERMYIKDLEEKIAKRKAWIEHTLKNTELIFLNYGECY